MLLLVGFRFYIVAVRRPNASVYAPSGACRVHFEIFAQFVERLSVDDGTASIKDRIGSLLPEFAVSLLDSDVALLRIIDRKTGRTVTEWRFSATNQSPSELLRVRNREVLSCSHDASRNDGMIVDRPERFTAVAVLKSNAGQVDESTDVSHARGFAISIACMRSRGLPLNVTLLGLFSAIGEVVGLLIVQREARRKHWDTTQLYNGLMVVMIVAIVGARVYYALVFNPSVLLRNPLRMFAFHESGLSIQGGMLGGILGGAIYFRLKRASFWRAADTIAPGIILAQAIGRVGCDVFGVEMTRSVPWAVAIDGRYLHPAQMYESVLNYLLFLGLWSLRDRTRKHGELFLIYVAGFATNRFVVEFFRTNPLVWGPLTVAHVTSIVMVVVAALLLGVLRARGAEIDDSSELPAAGKMKAAAGVAALMIVSVIVYYLIYRG